MLSPYKLCYNIQDEVFEMFPDYKSNPEKYGLHKNYCNKLPNLNLNDFNFSKKTTIKESKFLVKQAFDRIYYWASDNAIPETNQEWNLNTKMHPKGKMDKWNYNARYSYVNFHKSNNKFFCIGFIKVFLWNKNPVYCRA